MFSLILLSGPKKKNNEGILDRVHIAKYFIRFAALMGSMDSNELETHLTEAGIDPQLANQVVLAGWSLKTFKEIASTASDFTDDLFSAFVPDHSFSLLQKAQFKAAWRSLNGGESPLASAAAPSQPSAPYPEGSWSEAFPPKLDSAIVSQLKQKFLRSYPSEVLTVDTIPGPRMLSLTYQWVKKGEVKWLPWKYRISAARADEMAIQKPTKIPKLENLQLHQLLVDDIPALDISNQSLGLNAVRMMFDLHNYAWALVSGAHLHRLRAYSLKFLSFLTVRLDAESGLRAPNMLEAQQADKSIWHQISELCEAPEWDLNDALLEFTQHRGDMAALLQPRPRLPKAMVSSGVPAASSKGSGKSFPKGQQKGKSTKGQTQTPKWLSELWEGSNRKILCMRYQAGKCQNKDCRFEHKCGYPTPQGACGGDHPASQHGKTPH